MIKELKKLPSMPLKSTISLFLYFIITTNTYAFKLSPIVQEFGNKSRDKTKTFRVINTGKESIKLEAEILTRNINLDNEETREDTDDFVVYPPQIELKAGASRAIRVTYIGAPVSIEKSYRMIVRQIPGIVKEKKSTGNQINFLLEYVASLYVTPDGANSKLEISKASKKNKFIVIEFQNSGKKHQLLKNFELTLSQKKLNKIIRFDSEKFQELGSQNILAGLKRKIKIPDTTFKDGDVSAVFKSIKD